MRTTIILVLIPFFFISCKKEWDGKGDVDKDNITVDGF